MTKKINEFVKELPMWAKAIAFVIVGSLSGGVSSNAMYPQINYQDNIKKMELVIEKQDKDIDSINLEINTLKANNEVIWVKLDDISDDVKETRSDVKEIANYLRDHK